MKGKDLTKWGKDAQLDFSVELAKAKASGAEAIFVFYPGKAGGAFIKQYEQSGLRQSMPLYSVFTVDSIALPKLQQANMAGVLGSLNTQFWGPDLDTPQNKIFVDGFKAKYGRYPSFYAAQSYDMVLFIKSAVDAVGGNLEDIDGIRTALESADYNSIRGGFRMGSNHFPIQNFYVREVVADADGVWTTAIKSVVYENHQDVYAAECSL